MLLTRQLSALRLAFIVVCGFMIYGCASNGIQTSTGEQATNIIEVFERGEARLNCETSCSGAWGSARRQAKRLYEQGLWNDLAIEVARVGFKADQTYFYLGRAAEGLGHAEAARTYYKLGLASSYKCAGIINNCDGLVFPNEIMAGINRLPTPAKAEKPAVASSSNLIAPAENTLIVKKAQEEPSPIRTPALIAKVEPPKVDLRPTIKVNYDEFKKLTEYEGSNVATGGDVVFLRAWKPDKSPMVMQIYVMDYYSDEWRFYHSAWDSDGVKLDTTQISRDVGSCSRYSGCSHYEHLGLNVTRDYLEKHRQTGVRFKLSGKAGEEVFSIPAAHIDAFLEVAK
ncbi:hypothetical protein [Stutzerimonas stutzeri]|uniref:hypothetical protein n=1 Tax=Stutzerimonas stutzeri TaxID=316 RepID=UPI0034D77C0E